ncbi:MAG: DUF2505 family protein [Deltaproteobacteria bacterium]|nr:DUF2505 family protein [Deltaproteobacteria bacterium]
MKMIVDTLFQNVTLDRFIEVYFSEDFNNRVAAVAGLKSRDLVEETIHADGSRDRRVRLHPNVTLPTIIKKWASEDQIHYDEVAHYDAIKKEATYRIDSKANDRVKVGGVIRFTAAGAGVRRLIDGVIEIKAPFGVGTIIEKFIEGETQKGYAKIATFLQGYLDERAPRS